MKTALKINFISFLFLSVACLSGCPHDPYRASLLGSDDVSASVHAAIGITSSYYGDGLVDDNEKKVVATYLNTVTDANMDFRKCAVGAHTAGSLGQTPFLGCATAFVQQASATDPASFGFKNAKAQTTLKTYLQAITTAIKGISLAIQSAKGK